MFYNKCVFNDRIILCHKVHRFVVIVDIGIVQSLYNTCDFISPRRKNRGCILTFGDTLMGVAERDVVVGVGVFFVVYTCFLNLTFKLMIKHIVSSFIFFHLLPSSSIFFHLLRTFITNIGCQNQMKSKSKSLFTRTTKFFVFKSGQVGLGVGL